MSSTAEIIMNYVCPILGMISANIMFMAPYRDAKKACVETGRLGDLNPTPWAFMLGNCFGWVGYSMLIDSIYMLLANAPGFILSVWLNMVAVKLQYENQKSVEMNKSMIGVLRESSRNPKNLSPPMSDASTTPSSDAEMSPSPGGDVSSVGGPNDPEHVGFFDAVTDYAKIVWEVAAQHKPVPAPHERLVLGIVMYWVAVMAFLAFGKNPMIRDNFTLIFGLATNMNLIFFFGAPLSTIATVLKERSSASIHRPSAITVTFNGFFWAAYGLAVSDFLIMIPNGLGGVMGAIQVFFCLMFPARRRQDMTLPTSAVQPLPPTSASVPPVSAMAGGLTEIQKQAMNLEIPSLNDIPASLGLDLDRNNMMGMPIMDVEMPPAHAVGTDHLLESEARGAIPPEVMVVGQQKAHLRSKSQGFVLSEDVLPPEVMVAGQTTTHAHLRSKSHSFVFSDDDNHYDPSNTPTESVIPPPPFTRKRK